MLSTIAFFAVPTLLIISVVFLVFDRKVKGEIERKKLAVGNFIDSIKVVFKQDIEQICQTYEISHGERNQLYRIANNFFVFHTVNEINAISFENRMNLVANAFLTIDNEATQGYDKNIIGQTITDFAKALPKNARGFNIAFYQSELNVLIQLLELPAPEVDEIDSIDDEFIVDKGFSSFTTETYLNTNGDTQQQTEQAL
ncbi:MAG: hypothetical protein HRU25_14675 [Psychrobium sp.]|nr:hypothetical protein [Psychrobium sp.]